MLGEHHVYVSDRVRNERFAAAVRSTLKPGDVVVDLGCGTGILGLICLKAGASHVYAIERGDMASVASSAYAQAGFRDRVTVIQKAHSDVDLPERADVVICDHVGHFGIDYDIVALISDARGRLLKDGGQIIPRRISLYIGAVGSEDVRRRRDSWAGNMIGPEFRWLRTHDVNRKHAVDLTREGLITSPVMLGAVDLSSETRDFFSWSADLVVERDGEVDGIAGWFDCLLADGICMSNSPFADQPINRSQAFLPIDKSFRVEAGDVLQVSVMVRPTDNLMAWSVAFPRKGLRFDHSTWNGMLLDRQATRRVHPDRVARLNERGRTRLAILSLCDGRRTMAEIQETLMTANPALFRNADAAAATIADVLRQNTETC